MSIFFSNFFLFLSLIFLGYEIIQFFNKKHTNKFPGFVFNFWGLFLNCLEFMKFIFNLFMIIQYFYRANTKSEKKKLNSAQKKRRPLAQEWIKIQIIFYIYYASVITIKLRILKTWLIKD